MTTAHDAEQAPIREDDLVAISTDVWACFVGADVDGPDMPVPYAAPRSSDDASVLATISISGAWNGHVVLELSPDSAAKAARLMFDADTVDDAEVTDAVGELVNMVGGNLKSLVPGPSNLGLPTVVQGTVQQSHGRGTAEVCRMDFGWAGDPLRLTVWASHLPDNNQE